MKCVIKCDIGETYGPTYSDIRKQNNVKKYHLEIFYGQFPSNI